MPDSDASPPLLMEAWRGLRCPVIGMIHLPPLPGSPRYRPHEASVADRALHDAEALQASGVHALMIENFGDAPFYPDRVPPITIAHMTAIAAAVHRSTDLPVGVNVLRNDAAAALAVAHAAGAQFIRVNVLCGARVTDQGLIQGQAHELLRQRASLAQNPPIRILADVDVKHSAPLGQERPLTHEMADLTERSLADGLILSGHGTAQPADLAQLQQARRAAPTTPLLIGSGIDASNLAEYLPHVDALIVGSTLKYGCDANRPVDPNRVRHFIAAWEAATKAL